MTSRELVIKTLQHEPIPQLPRHLWTVPYINIHRGDEHERVLSMFPMDITGPTGIQYGKSRYTKGEAFRKGKYTDAFGAEWVVLEDGVAGEVKDPLIKTVQDLDNYKLPWEILDEAVCDGQTAAYKDTDLFVLANTEVRPFERMQFLRGTEQLFIDMALEDPMFFRLKEMLHEFNLRELKFIASQAVDAIAFMDDWGSQQTLLISPASWRKYYKPMYKEYCDIIHEAGKYVFFHSDGHTEAIYDDLIEIGVDAFNSQLFCMDIEGLGEKYAGKITFWGELDRQHILPFGTEDDVRASVRRLKKALFRPERTGVIAQFSWETLTPFENAVAAFDEFAKI